MMIESETELLEKWYEKVRRGQIAQYSAANRARRLYYFLGIPTALFSALAGGFIFYGIEEFTFGLPLVISILGLLASIFASIQTFLGPSSVIEHEVAAKKFGELKRRAQLAMACKPDDVQNWLELFKSDWDKVSEMSPLSPSKLFNKESR